MKLRKGVAIPLEHLVANYGGILFYDAAPPLAYLLQVLWDKVFPAAAKEEAFRAPVGASGSASRPQPVIEVEVAQVARDLRDSFSMRLLNPTLPECPRLDVVREALDTFASWGLAEKTGESIFTVKYRKLHPGTLDYILKKLVPEKKPKKGRKVPESQLTLFKREIERPLRK
jgi:hypothetical protein